jgi:outer membrane protein
VICRWASTAAIIALTVSLPLAAQDSTSARLEVSLPDALRRALDADPDMVQADGTRRTAGAARMTALGSFLPNLTVSGAVSKNSQQRFDQNSQQLIPPIPNFSTGLSANIDLFTGFRRLANLRATGASIDAAEAGVVSQRFQVQLATKQAFYNALATEELVRVAEAQVRRTRQQLQISVEKLRAGSATRSDSLRSTVDYGNARIALLQAQANLATAQATLGRQIGVDQPVRAVPDSALPALPDTSTLRAAVLSSAPQLQQAEAQARAARANVWAARSPYVPSLNLSFGSNRQDTIFSNALVANEVHNWRVGLSWTLFNGFNREQANVSARVQRDVAEAQAADTRRLVSAQFTQQMAALSTAQVQIEIAGANLAAATEDLRVQQERYRVGAATILDLLTSQAALTQAEVNSVQTRFNYLIARAQLEALVGRTL